MKVAVTGKEGFIGYHLYNTINYSQNKLNIVDFDKSFFDSKSKLDKLIGSVDVIIHLAGVNRADDNFLIETNINLSKSIAESAERTNFKGKIIFASSILEDSESAYGKSKKISTNIFLESSKNNNYSFTSIIIPNVFGPFCKPNYNSFVSTFCHNLIFSKKIDIQIEKEVKLIFVNNLIDEILKIIINKTPSRIEIKEDTTSGVIEVKNLLDYYYNTYLINDQIPAFNSDFEKNLFLTFQSFIDIKDHFPRKTKTIVDDRGSFSEIVRSLSSGQSSFSETKPGITRGNHFHTRKIERFSVVKGRALVEIRKIGTNKTFSFELNGEKPYFIDMKVWHTHNIKNIGETDLVTFFWINEFYNDKDTDTFFEIV